MTDRAERAIKQAFENGGDNIRTFNELIETMEDAAMASGMRRETLLSLLLTSSTAIAGGGRSAHRNERGPDAMIYKTIQDSTMAASTGVDALRQTR